MRLISLKSLAIWSFSCALFLASGLPGISELPAAVSSASASERSLGLSDTADLRVFEGVADSFRQDVYFLLVTNQGPDTAQNVVLTFPVPAGARFDRVQLSDRLTCTLPPSFGTGEIICSLEDMPSGKSILINVYLSFLASPGSKIIAEAQVVSDTPDSNPSNNTYRRENVVAGIPGFVSVGALKEPFRIEITGQNLIVPQVFSSGIGIGCDCVGLPISAVTKLPTGEVILSGNELKRQFPRGVPTQICYFDIFRGAVIKTTFTR
jgi:hypothetical protein